MFRDGFIAPLDELRRLARGQGLDRAAPAAGHRRDGNQVAEDPLHLGFRLLHRSHENRISHAVPPTLASQADRRNGERFITPELKEVESKILGADERAKALEHELFVQLRDEVLRELAPLQETAAAIATLDVLCALAETARLFGYCRPFYRRLSLRIDDGRHPVLDQSLVEEKFVPNDVLLDDAANRLLILTGPNMAGKSTYIRQVALLVLMAQIGSWIPARTLLQAPAGRLRHSSGAWMSPDRKQVEPSSVAQRQQQDVAMYVAAGADESVQRVMTAVHGLSRRLDQWYDRQLADLDLSSRGVGRSMSKLVRDGGADGLTPSVLADAANVAPSSMTHRLDRMAERGLITRSTDPENRVRVRVQLTDAGWELFRSVIRESTCSNPTCSSPLSARDRVKLAELLEKAIEGLDIIED